ncbi:MAG TPA: hypothetical protein VFC56_16440 [Stellaceae bacterium]|nr:hypothetical protein [Stellaceae bacterium]
MTLRMLAGRTGRALALTTAITAAIGLTTVPQPAHALGTGAAVGIGLGALAVGTALGAASNPYYGAPGYGYGYNPGYYPGYYAPPAPAYYGYAPGPARSCWSPYYGRYYPC